MDTFTKEKRHEIMSHIKSKDTKLEVNVRRWLFHKGVRYRKNYKKVFGKPDIAMTKYKIAIFVNGCFWHGHDQCRLYRCPKSHVDYWKPKIEKNKERDKENIHNLKNAGWHVFTVWECQLEADFEGTMKQLYEDIMCVKNLKYRTKM